MNKALAETATGWPGAGGYIEYARSRGFKHIVSGDISSSVGDWSFLVSKDRKKWYYMTQVNLYPTAGFEHHINDAPVFVFKHKASDTEVMLADAQHE
jgi:hypothetical protein